MLETASQSRLRSKVLRQTLKPLQKARTGRPWYILQTPGGNGYGKKSAVAALCAASASGAVLTSAGNGMYVTTEAGIYEVQNVFAGSANLMYTDLQTGERIFLCAQPSCAHNSESCPSYLATPGAMFPPQLLRAGNQLLVFYTESTAQSGPALYSMALDGSQKTKVLELGANQTVMGGFVTDGTQLYFDILEVDAQGHDRLLLLCADLAKNECRTVCELGSDGAQYQLMGCAGTNLVLQSVGAGRLQYYLADPAAPAFETPAFTDPSPSGSSMTADGYLFVLDEGAHTVTRTDFVTGGSVTAAYPHQIGFSRPSMRYLYDGKVLVEGVGPVTDGQYEVAAYWVDPAQNTAREMTLRTPYNGNPVYVLADLGERVYVSTDYKMYTPKASAQDGTQAEFDVVLNVYALMTKQDYEASNAAGYQLVRDVLAQ